MMQLHFYRIWLMIGWGMVMGIILLSLVPVPDAGVELPSDKLLHLVAYALLMGWFVQLYRGSARRAFALGFICLGIVLELLQGMTPYRMFEWWDMVANGSGVALSYLLGLTAFDQLLSRFERLLRAA